ncbi:hypothetical protein HBI29_198210 [Parastagonospora nodorum]|nr:hypothetical protein HBH49_216570 [Parastagonospora nodorum]KAH4072410.1 hypothetical protein HBH50_059230 [Parastagonospora nodorum]KAH4088922.1 hypothetical protein HBH48_120690 [Parastagonospora nodorum]KAH4602445.1 hypothetical protein HBH82_158230 [Parastagonospora nodorum]KAH4686431.1 hypothetical protein HBH78_108610 [Parastagonospora nodorum]
MHIPLPLLTLLLSALPTLAMDTNKWPFDIRWQTHGLHPCVHTCNAFGNGDKSQELACVTCWHYGKETIDESCKMCAFKCAKKRESRLNDEYCNNCLTMGANPAHW